MTLADLQNEGYRPVKSVIGMDRKRQIVTVMVLYKDGKIYQCQSFNRVEWTEPMAYTGEV